MTTTPVRFWKILTGMARQLYLDVLRPKSMSTPERRGALLREWDSISLKFILFNSLDQSPSDRIDLLVSKLSDIQTSLPEDYQSDTILRDKLINPVRAVSDCLLASRNL